MSCSTVRVRSTCLLGLVACAFVAGCGSGAASRDTKHVPMQARVGDYALFFRKAAVEITFEDERFLVVPQAAILTLAR